jgi:hypothetical protein
MSQILKKFIGDNQVGSEQIRLEATQYLRSRNNSNTADVNLLRFNSNGNIGVATNIEPEGGGNLGTATNVFPAVFANDIKDSSDLIAVNVLSRELNDLSNNPAIDFSDRVALDSTGSTSIEWQNRFLADTSGNTILEYGTDVSVFQDLIVRSNNNLTLNNAANTQGVSITAPSALAASYSLVLPADDGASGQVLQTDGAGALSWVTPAGGGSTFGKETFTLSAGDITNQYVDLAVEAAVNSIQFLVKGAGVVLEGASHDYTVSYTGGSGGVTRITFANDLATSGAAALVAGDVIQIQYTEA